VFAAGIDVFEEEPARGNKLFDLENVFVTRILALIRLKARKAPSCAGQYPSGLVLH
jgi:phosphoglycerate dehydrogenase-like enzyme